MWVHFHFLSTFRDLKIQSAPAPAKLALTVYWEMTDAPTTVVWMRNVEAMLKRLLLYTEHTVRTIESLNIQST